MTVHNMSHLSKPEDIEAANGQLLNLKDVSKKLAKNKSKNNKWLAIICIIVFLALCIVVEVVIYYSTNSPPAPQPTPTTITIRNVTVAIQVPSPTTTDNKVTDSIGNLLGEVVATQSSFQVGERNDASGASSNFQSTTIIPVLQLLPTPTHPETKIQVFAVEHFNGASETFELTEKCLLLPRNWQDRISSVNTFGEYFELCTDENCNQCEKVAPGTPSHDQLRNIEGLDKRTK